MKTITPEPGAAPSIAGRIRQERERLGMSEQVFAEEAHLDADRLFELEDENSSKYIQFDELAYMSMIGVDANYVLIGVRKNWVRRKGLVDADGAAKNDSEKGGTVIDPAFQSRIHWLLGDRQKHPWGRSLGLKNSRIDSIFRGIIPQADALLRIRAAEQVNIDWLLTGEGAPLLRKQDTEEEERLLQAFRRLPGYQRAALLEIANGLALGGAPA